jgi:glutamyl-Q tRNA(Asp) synthetase
VRIEDLDTPRVVPGSADRILRTLEGFGLEWDGEVAYQSRRIPLYRAALEQLKAGGHTFQCSCSRRELGGSEEAGYPGTCRNGPTRRHVPTSTRFRLADGFVVLFDDRVQGPRRFAQHELGDFVIQRKDGIIAYQLAVIVDDHAQQVTNVVRGADLLASTGWQIALHRALGMVPPSYAHLPLVTQGNAEKLSKSRQSVPVGPDLAATYLTAVLRLLNHVPPAELENDTPARLLAWAMSNWDVKAFQNVAHVTAFDITHAKKLGSNLNMD